MADYRDNLYEEVDNLFNTMGGAKDHFMEGNILEDPTVYEIPNSQIQPAGWVQNSDPDISGSASVFIDSDGLTILNGKIFLEDYTGSSVLSPAGFAGSWIDFINSGIYNSQFNAGATSSGLTAEANTGVGTYEDWLSPDVPMWVVGDRTGTATYGIVDDATYGRAFEVVLSGAGTSGTVDIFQDVPVSAELYYSTHVRIKGTLTHSGAPSAWSAQVTSDWDWLDEDRAVISSGLSTSGGISSLDPESTDLFTIFSLAPVTAKYLRLYLNTNMSITGGTSPVLKMKILFAEVRREGSRSIILLDPWESFGESGYHQIDGVDMGAAVPDGGLNIKAGNGLNIFSYTADDTNDPVLAVRRTDDFSASVAMYEWGITIPRTQDVTTTSIENPLQIGNSGGDNVVFDNNEIMARSNGSTSTLFLNKDGGSVSLAGETVTVTSAGAISANGNITANADAEALQLSGNNYIEMTERGAGAPANPGGNEARIFLVDNGSGKTSLRVRFGTGAAITLATEA